MARRIDGLCADIHAIHGFLTVSRQSAGLDFERTAEAQCATLLQKMRTVTHLDTTDGTTLLQLLQSGPWPNRVVAKLVARVTELASTAPCVPDSRVHMARLQSFKTPENYLTETDWHTLGSDVNMRTKMERVIHRMTSLRLLNPNERTYQVLLGTILCAARMDDHGTRALNILHDFKKTYRAHNKNGEGQVTLDYPSDPKDFQALFPIIYARVYEHEPPAQCPLSHAELVDTVQRIPCRKTRGTGRETPHTLTIGNDEQNNRNFAMTAMRMMQQMHMMQQALVTHISPNPTTPPHLPALMLGTSPAMAASLTPGGSFQYTPTTPPPLPAPFFKELVDQKPKQEQNSVEVEADEEAKQEKNEEEDSTGNKEEPLKHKTIDEMALSLQQAFTRRKQEDKEPENIKGDGKKRKGEDNKGKGKVDKGNGKKRKGKDNKGKGKDNRKDKNKNIHAEDKGNTTGTPKGPEPPMPMPGHKGASSSWTG